MTAYAHSGMTSPCDPWRTAASAQSRWWFTMTTSAAAARSRMRVTKHSWYSGQSSPTQFSFVAAMMDQNGTSSGRSVNSARSPVSVAAAQASTIWR